MTSSVVQKAQGIYREFTPRFWILVGAHWINGIGRTMIFPFFALYVTQKFDVGMTQAGILLAVFSISGMVGNLAGGALTDRFGRRSMVLFGLVFSAFSSLALGLVGDLRGFFVLAVVVGFLSDISGPAEGAMVADLLPEEKRAEGFGVLRVAGNLAWIVGPTIGGLLATRSYLLLFILDAICSSITALIIYKMIPETRSAAAAAATEQESVSQTFRGYGRVLSDSVFLLFLAVCMLMNLVYLQMYSTFSVYLRDVHGIGARGYGLVMSLNACLVVILQFPVTRAVKRYPAMLVMSLGTVLYMVGFTAFGLVETYILFVVAMLVITFGEMIVIPVGHALVVQLAPEAMRGRYIAVFGISWALPQATGPWVAGIILDNYNPNLVWYLCGALAAMAALGFVYLHGRSRIRLAAAIPEPSLKTTAA
ncbi:MAG: MFS transporter [Anaerolineales bacterium]|nr:MFS transporter [Anaerolineales bacterium]